MRLKKNVLVSAVAVLGLGGTLALVGCHKADPAAAAESEQALQQLRDANQELQKLRAENQDLARLQRDNEELKRLRAETADLPRLRAENEQLRAQLQALKPAPKARP
jgi:TolA-binding protein